MRDDITSSWKECEVHKGFYDLGKYYHARPMKNGLVSMYEGCWTGNRCSTGYLTVRRDDSNKPLRFNSLTEAKEWVATR